MHPSSIRADCPAHAGKAQYVALVKYISHISFGGFILCAEVVLDRHFAMLDEVIGEGYIVHRTRGVAYVLLILVGDTCIVDLVDVAIVHNKLTTSAVDLHSIAIARGTTACLGCWREDGASYPADDAVCDGQPFGGAATYAV